MDSPAETTTPSMLRTPAAEWRAFAAAFTFLTRIPFHRVTAHDVRDLPASAAYFPVVGLIVAAVGGAAYFGASLLWAAPLAVVLSVALTVWLTGAFHEDALADSFDGFGGGWNRDQILAIMKDSRVGSYALVGMVLLLVGKLTALSVIAVGTNDSSASGPWAVVRALVAGHVLGRWSSIPLIWRYEYVRPVSDGERPSAGRTFVSGVTTSRGLAATALTLAIVVAALGWKAPAVAVVAVIVTTFGGRYAHQRLGGITGDVLGAVNQCVELATYLVLAARPIHG